MIRQSEPPHVLGKVSKRPGTVNHDNAETFLPQFPSFWSQDQHHKQSGIIYLHTNQTQMTTTFILPHCFGILCYTKSVSWFSINNGKLPPVSGDSITGKKLFIWCLHSWIIIKKIKAEFGMGVWNKSGLGDMIYQSTFHKPVKLAQPLNQSMGARLLDLRKPYEHKWAGKNSCFIAWSASSSRELGGICVQNIQISIRRTLGAHNSEAGFSIKITIAATAYKLASPAQQEAA